MGDVCCLLSPELAKIQPRFVLSYGLCPSVLGTALHVNQYLEYNRFTIAPVIAGTEIVLLLKIQKP